MDRRQARRALFGDLTLILLVVLACAFGSGWAVLLLGAELKNFSRYADTEGLWLRSFMIGLPAVFALGTAAFGGWVVSSALAAGWRRVTALWRRELG